MPKITKQISPARAWCFTLNNWTEEEYSSIVQRLLTNTNKYLFCVGKEVGESGTPHLQGVVMSREKNYKWRPIPKFSIKRDGKNVGHWSKMKKCFDANYFYCSKEGDFITNYEDPNAEKPFVPDWGTLYYGVNDGRCGGPKTGVEWIKLWHLSLKGYEDNGTDKMMYKWLQKLYKKELITDWDD